VNDRNSSSANGSAHARRRRLSSPWIRRCRPTPCPCHGPLTSRSFPRQCPHPPGPCVARSPATPLAETWQWLPRSCWQIRRSRRRCGAAGERPLPASSRISVAAPSPMTNPSRSRSKWPRAGLRRSLRHEVANMVSKTAVAEAFSSSAPPAIITSALPQRIALAGVADRHAARRARGRCGDNTTVTPKSRPIFTAAVWLIIWM